MTDCLYHAFEEYLRAIKLRNNQVDRDLFYAWRRQLQGGDVKADISVAPFYLQKLARRHNLQVQVETLDWMTPNHWASNAPNEACWGVCLVGPWVTVSELSGGPAIYFLWVAGHAAFARDVPESGLPIAAAYLLKEGERCQIKRKWMPWLNWKQLRLPTMKRLRHGRRSAS